jgi:RNA 3'-terminal phosphate cyclase
MPYLTLLWLPALREIGHDLEGRAGAAGYGAEAGGEATVTVGRGPPPAAIDRRSRGYPARGAGALDRLQPSLRSGGPAERAGAAEAARGGDPRRGGQPAGEGAGGPRGPAASCSAPSSAAAAGFAALGACEGDAERCAEEAAEAFVGFMRTRGAVDEQLADQLLVPLGHRRRRAAGPGQAGVQAGGARATEPLVRRPRSSPASSTWRCGAGGARRAGGGDPHPRGGGAGRGAAEQGREI